MNKYDIIILYMFSKKFLSKSYNNDRKIRELKNELKTKNSIIQELNYKLNLTIKENNKTICSICYDNKINICCIPCGHTYCDNCIINNMNCYICRNPIIRINKIYI